MPVLNMDGWDTQAKPMAAVGEVMQDYADGMLSGIEALRMIDAINYEWNH